jgi:hypothetical protein
MFDNQVVPGMSPLGMREYDVLFFFSNRYSLKP